MPRVGSYHGPPPSFMVLHVMYTTTADWLLRVWLQVSMLCEGNTGEVPRHCPEASHNELPSYGSSAGQPYAENPWSIWLGSNSQDVLRCFETVAFIFMKHQSYLLSVKLFGTSSAPKPSFRWERTLLRTGRYCSRCRRTRRRPTRLLRACSSAPPSTQYRP
jgi:hypothetical protein